MYNFPAYDPTTGIIDEIINSGQLNIVQNKKLKNEISNWSRVLVDTERDIKITNDHMYNVFIQYLIKHIKTKNIPISKSLLEKTNLPNLPTSNFSSDYSPVMKSFELENMVNQHALNLMYVIMEYINIQSYLEDTIVLIKSEIAD